MSPSKLPIKKTKKKTTKKVKRNTKHRSKTTLKRQQPIQHSTLDLATIRSNTSKKK